MPKEQKTRAQMDARFLWKLEDIYPTDQAWEEDFQKAKPAAARVAAFAGKLEQQLPGLRCGSCGAPSCHAFAEDVIMGRASLDDCIFKVRERMQHMAGTGNADEYLPAPFRHRPSDPSGGTKSR